MRLRNVLLVSIVALAGGALAMEFAARSAAVRVARALEPVASLTYESAGITWDGSIRLRAPRLVVEHGIWRGSMRARLADLRGSSRFWLIGQALLGGSALPGSITLTVHGLNLDGSASESTALGWLGTPDLALFENQGCGSDALSDKDRQRMGVAATERVDSFEFHHDRLDKSIAMAVDLDSANIANWQGYAEFGGFDPERWSEHAAQQSLRLVRAGLSYRDPGYLARRNKFCAQWLGVSNNEFIDRHVEAVRSFLASRGINPSEDVLSLYRRLVTRGGSLNLASLPDASWVPAEFEAYPRQVLLRQLNITARLDDAPPIMLRLGFSEPETPIYVVRPKPAEPVAQPMALAEGPPPIAPGVPEAAPPAPRAEEVAPAPPETAPAPALPAPSLPAATPSEKPAVTAAQEDAPPSVDPGRVPAMLIKDGKVVASAPPPPPNSTLALVWEPGVIERLPAQQPKDRDYDVIPANSLGQRIGRRVQLVTIGGKRVDGEVQAVDSGNLVLLVQVGRGKAKLNVPLSNIREARLFRSRPPSS